MWTHRTFTVLSDAGRLTGIQYKSSHVMAAKEAQQVPENRDRLFSVDKKGQEDNGPTLQEDQGVITVG